MLGWDMWAVEGLCHLLLFVITFILTFWSSIKSQSTAKKNFSLLVSRKGANVLCSSLGRSQVQNCFLPLPHFLYLFFMSRKLFLNIMKPQDSLHGSEQTQISSAPLARMMFVREKQKISSFENPKTLWQHQHFYPSRKKKKEYFFWRLFLVKFKLGFIQY